MDKPRINWDKHIGKWTRYKEFETFLNSSYMYKVLTFLSQEYRKHNIYPKKQDIFKSFRLCDPDELKVVILGSEPYTNDKSTGLAFANSEGTISVDPPLVQLKNAVELDVCDGLKLDFDITLENWAKQGVLLLNTSLTSSEKIVNAHTKVWNKFMTFVVEFLSDRNPGTIFLLWGRQAQKFEAFSTFKLKDNSYIFRNVYPYKNNNFNMIWSCNHFSEANKIIKDTNGKEFCIEW